MKIAIDGGVMISSAGRGMGVYTENLVKALLKVCSEEGHSLDVVNAAKDDLSKFDLIHYPSFDFFYHTLPIRKVIPTVVTVHDTIPLIYPKHYPPGIRGTFNLYLQKVALKSCKAIIADSKTSEKDIIRFLNVPPENIYPIYLGPTKKPAKVSNNQQTSPSIVICSCTDFAAR